MAIIIDGKALSQKRKGEIEREVSVLKENGIVPGLAVIQVGDNPASSVYVRNKDMDCKQCGINSIVKKLPESTTEGELLQLIAELNEDTTVNGILVQLPVPEHISERAIIEAIAPEKDVDAFHPVNVGQLMTGNNRFVPCTPAGVMKMLAEYGIDPAGKHCVVIGRSNIVGKPMAILLLQKNGTVSICHSRTPDLKEITRQADILISAVGKCNLVTKDMVKNGAVVIDVAMNRNDAGKLCGDVAFDEVKEVASYISPVPGGVGPMTRLMLLENTLNACRMQNGIPIQNN